MKHLFFVLLCTVFCLGALDAQTKHKQDSISSTLYFVYKDVPDRDSLVQAYNIDKSRYNYRGRKYITHIPQVSEFPMYKEEEVEKFGFLFNDPHYSATEKKKVAAIILQGADIESKIINEIRYITLDKEYAPSPAGNFTPIFPGGYRAITRYLNEYFPISSIEKNREDLKDHTYLIVCFIVEKDGTLGHIKIIDSCNDDLDRKAYKLIKDMPKWVTSPQTVGKPIFVAMQLIFNKEL